MSDQELRETIARAIESLTQEEIPSGRAMAAAERVVRAMKQAGTL
jgi:hypothetical protein